MRSYSSSVAIATLEADFPLPSVQIALSCVCICCCTLNRQGFKTGCLVVDEWGFSCRFLSLSQTFLRDGARLRWVWGDSGPSCNPQVSIIQSGGIRIPRWHIFCIFCDQNTTRTTCLGTSLVSESGSLKNHQLLNYRKDSPWPKWCSSCPVSCTVSCLHFSFLVGAKTNKRLFRDA